MKQTKIYKYNCNIGIELNCVGGILNNSLRPTIPDNCNIDWRKLMEECWSTEPSSRPTFTEITNRFRDMSNALHSKSRNQPKKYTDGQN